MSAPTEWAAAAARTPDQEILFVGGVFPRDEEPTILGRSRGPVQNAANALQWTLVNGLDAALPQPVSILNAVFVGSYPRLYRDWWIPGRHWAHAPGARDRSIGFPNLFGLKHLWRTAILALRASAWARSTAAAPRALVLYSMHAPFMLAAAAARRADPSVVTCMIVPDLPEHMGLSERRSFPVRFLGAVDRWLTKSLLRHIDCFVLLTRQMAEPLGVSSERIVVMEGAIDSSDWPETPPASGPSAAEKVILYTGTLQKAYGILDLLSAFRLVRDPECRLWVCGAGEAEEEVRRAARDDPRVRYLGQLRRGEVLALQRSAAVLVNPRSDAGEFTQYSFPSKILEYLASGTPAVVRWLPGIPPEYRELLFVVDGPDPADLARTISEVCALPATERARHGKRARRFVLEHKTGAAQARRILELVATVRAARNMRRVS